MSCITYILHLQVNEKPDCFYSIHLLPRFQAPLRSFKFVRTVQKGNHTGWKGGYDYVDDALHIRPGDIGDYFNLLRASVFRWEDVPSVPGCPDNVCTLDPYPGLLTSPLLKKY